MFKRAFVLFVNALLAFSCPIVRAEQGEERLIDRFSLNVDLETYFDNREYSNVSDHIYRSGSDFALKFVPTVSYNFYGAHSLIGGASWVEPFGDVGESGGVVSSTYFNSLKPVIYYKAQSESWSVAAGLFPHSETMIGSYSTPFFADDYLFYDNIISGLMGRYSWGDSSYLEMICNWRSQSTDQTREIFMLLSSANVAIGQKFYAGYSFSLTHFAGSEALGVDNVVDNTLVNPFVGFKCEGKYAFDLRVGALISMQRDRSYENEWLVPVMGEAGFSVSRWGFSLDERFYYGDDLMPLYDGHPDLYYAEDLYMGDPFFRVNGVYNRAEIKYERKFAKDKMAVDVGFVTHIYDGTLNTEQRLRLTMMLDINTKTNKKRSNE